MFFSSIYVQKYTFFPSFWNNFFLIFFEKSSENICVGAFCKERGGRIPLPQGFYLALRQGS